MYHYLTIDAELHGTGIRTSYDGEYVKPHEIGIDKVLEKRINEWVESYSQVLIFDRNEPFKALDNEGIKIAQLIKQQFPEKKIKYFSAGTCKEILI